MYAVRRARLWAPQHCTNISVFGMKRLSCATAEQQSRGRFCQPEIAKCKGSAYGTGKHLLCRAHLQQDVIMAISSRYLQSFDRSTGCLHSLSTTRRRRPTAANVARSTPMRQCPQMPGMLTHLDVIFRGASLFARHSHRPLQLVMSSTHATGFTRHCPHETVGRRPTRLLLRCKRMRYCFAGLAHSVATSATCI